MRKTTLHLYNMKENIIFNFNRVVLNSFINAQPMKYNL